MDKTTCVPDGLEAVKKRISLEENQTQSRLWPAFVIANEASSACVTATQPLVIAPQGLQTCQ